ncbi:sulfite exporter TauE/SafE family protein [Alloacidobacterium dinghuense]|uniref:Probable membrane transporter protein n=1 Tax=Alloacidobacterium dinghuense TaxID=2763107 RepID=A0A7G8BEP7_9BACT|nr:sulfite exporter TauE/SafE family protein [Alloacidobacterium dinghuense]QNI31017.1 sulfite exporter TauE/SafE family protein [Alloacidobacterium dinghuense]
MHVRWDGNHIWLVVASLIAGGLNAVAGGGSFLSFPALLQVGVLQIQANATNTVALWPGQLTSIAAYFEDLKHNLRLVLPLCVSAAIGGVAGGIVLLHTAQKTFLHLVPWLLLVAALLFAASTPISRWLQRRSRGKAPGSSHPSHLPLFIGMMVVCFYIGYFGAGAGFLIISLLAIFGIENINQINALKVVTTTLANGVAVLVFVVEKQVLWQHCLLMMLTAAMGGYFGARFSRKLNPVLMRSAVVCLGLGMAAYFFWKQS